MDALRRHAQHGAERVDEAGLRKARDTDEQAVAAREHRDQNLVDHLALAEDDAADGFAHPGEFRDGVFDLANDGIRIIESVHGVRH